MTVWALRPPNVPATLADRWPCGRRDAKRPLRSRALGEGSLGFGQAVAQRHDDRAGTR
jgi:hypothetical protein